MSFVEKVSENIFCAFCRLERRVFTKKNISWTNVGLSILTSTVLMFLVWQRFDPRVVIFFIMTIFIAEIFVHIRWRMGLSCPHCGFDPLLYKANRTEAAKRVRVHLEELKLSGGHLLKKNNPFLNLPKITRTDGEKKSGLLSRQV